MKAHVFTVLVLAAALLACSSAEERAEQARADARTALGRGQRVAALEAIEELRAVQPDSADAVIELTQLLIGAGEAAQAVWVLEAGLAKFPGRDDLRLELARAALLTSDASLARSTLAEIPAASEQHPEGLILLAQAELQLGDEERALQVLAAGAARYPDLPQLRISHIATLITERRFDEARTAITEARAGLAEEALPRIRHLEASLYRAVFMDGIELAEPTEDGALADETTSDSADDSADNSTDNATDDEKRQRVAESRERALERLRELVAEDPEDLTLWQAVADAHWRAGQAALAVTLLEQQLAASPDQVGLYPFLSQLRGAAGDEPAALEAMEEFALRSSSPSGYLALARFHSKRRRDLDALATLEQALEEFPDTALLLKARTESLIGMERLAEAKEELARFEAAAPGVPEVEFLRGQLEFASGDPEAAAERLLRLVPEFDNAGTQFWLGRALEALGDRAGAERRYRLAFIRQPTEPVLTRAVVHMAEQRGDWQMVIAYGQRLLSLEPLAEDAWDVLIRALIQLEQGEFAEQLARRAIGILDASTRLRVQLVRSLLVQKNYDAALAEAALATEKLGDHPEIEAERALALGMRGDVAEGARVAAAALARHAESSRLYIAIAALAFADHDRESGANAVDQALALAPEDPTPLRLRAEFMTSSGQWKGAQQDCERYLALRPDDPNVHHIHGVALAGAGRTAEAIAAYERAAKLDRKAWAPRNNLAELLRERGEIDGALDWAQQAFSLAEGDPYVADTLGWLYLEKGLVDRAVGLLEEANAGVPEHPVVKLHLALAYRAASRADEARSLLTDVLEQSPPDSALQAQAKEALHSLE